MDHVAIMKKSWGLIPKILDGRKKIESRWGRFKSSPWGKVKAGDTVYFKNSGEPIVATATVDNIEEFPDLKPSQVKDILTRYGGDDGISVPDLPTMFSWAKNKRYCTLIFLKDPHSVRPFHISKRGFGTPAAWITIPNIQAIKQVASPLS